MIKKKVRQWLIETIPTSQFLMSGLHVIFFVHGEDWRLWSLGGINKKDDVQTRNEGFPRIWFWENLTPLDRRQDNINMLNGGGVQGGYFIPGGVKGSEREVGDCGGDAAGLREGQEVDG